MNYRIVPLLPLMLATPPVAAEMSFLSSTTDRLEHHFEHGDTAIETDLMLRNDERAYLLRFEGAKPEDEDLEGELQLLLSKPWTAYFDWQIGVEASFHDGSTTPGIVAGIEGEAPYRIETEARLTLNEDGELFLHAEFERDFLLTQKLVLQPRIGFLLGDDDEEVAAEIRLRYEVSRKFVPYVGLSWERIYDGVDSGGTTTLAGVAFWF